MAPFANEIFKAKTAGYCSLLSIIESITAHIQSWITKKGSSKATCQKSKEKHINEVEVNRSKSTVPLHTKKKKNVELAPIQLPCSG